MNIRIIIILIVVVVLLGSGFLLLSSQRTATPDAVQNGTHIQATDLAHRMAVCESIPNGTTQEISETTRLFINLPEDIYPYENRHFTSTGAMAGTVSNGEGVGPQKSSMEEFAANKCATHYYEFSGSGTVDLTVTSALAGIPDYTIHFRVK